MNIVITEQMDMSAIAALKLAADVTYDPDLFCDTERLAALMPGTDGLIVRNQTRVMPALLAHADRLRVVGRLGVGLDNIDTAYCRAAGIKVIPAIGANAVSVAEYVIAAALMLTRRCFFADSVMRAGGWPRATLSEGSEVCGKVLGLVGFGNIGKQVARLAQGVGMEVVAHDPGLADDAAVWAECEVRPLTISALAATADVISLHVPLIPKTRHLVSSELLSAMKPGAVVINTSRGGVIDELALVDALRRGALAGAALDVYEQEPLPATDRFDGVENLILTPHVAGVTRESNLRISQMIARAVLDHLAVAAV